MREFAVRGSLFSICDDPRSGPSAWTFLEDGILCVADGHIRFAAPSSECLESIRDSMPVLEYPNSLICPGFIDAHIHYAQTRIIGSPAPGLLEWLNQHTFPEELCFADEEYAQQVADEFFDELICNGTTSALVFPTVHAVSAERFFAASQLRGMRMVAGKVLMDRNAPKGLCDTASGIAEAERLIARWHGKGRQSYAVTLRFAGTSSRAQMEACQALLKEYPQLLFHTHLSETQAEIDWTLGLYPECADYVGVYEQYGMVNENSVFAHCVHLSESECQRLADQGCAAALCPTSNLFLGSGLVNPNWLAEHGIQRSLGTDVGGGTSFSMLQTMQEMYKVGRAAGAYLDAFELFYLATLGSARALHIDRYVGSFEPGKEADFLVLDAGNSQLMQRRLEMVADPEKLLFAYIILGNSDNVRETWSMGECLYRRRAA